MVTEYPQYDEREIDYFECDDPSKINDWKWYPSNVQKRVYGIVNNSDHIFGAHLPRTSSNRIAYCSQWGIDWEKSNQDYLKRSLKKSMHGGRALEIYLTENLINRHDAFDYMPPFEMDAKHSIDMISRVPFVERETAKLHTLAMATQVTVSPIPQEEVYKYENPNKQKKKLSKRYFLYHKKYNQIQQLAEKLQNDDKKNKEMLNTFGRINMPDVVSFLAVNGKIGRLFSRDSRYTWHLYNLWKRENFWEPMLTNYLNLQHQEALKVLAEFVRWTQKEVLPNYTNASWRISWFKKTEYSTQCKYNKQNATLECALVFCNGEGDNADSYKNIAKITYFLTKDTKEKLGKLQK